VRAPRLGRGQTEFERFAAEHADGLLRSAYLMVGDRSEAEEILQECLWRLARRWSRIRSVDHQGAYARKVLVNLVLDGASRRARRRSELPESAFALDPDRIGQAVESERHADLLQALGELPVRQRAVLVLRYYGDLPETEVARILGCSLGTVKSAGSRGIARLREALERNEASDSCHAPPTATGEGR
jgi:RNA polymerase sigma-70 factor (sigma-E family)